MRDSDRLQRHEVEPVAAKAVHVVENPTNGSTEAASHEVRCRTGV